MPEKSNENLLALVNEYLTKAKRARSEKNQEKWLRYARSQVGYAVIRDDQKLKQEIEYRISLVTRVLGTQA